MELLCVLAADSDSTIAERAKSALLAQPVERFLAAAVRTAPDPHLFTYCAHHLGEKAGVADALAKNTVCPIVHVTRVSQHLTAAGIQALLDNMERFVSDPQLVTAVCASPAATPEQRDLLSEVQKPTTALNTKELEDAAVMIEPDPVKRESLMQRVSKMNVVQRLTLALKGDRTERMFLIHDSNKLVQRCVLQSPRLTDLEVEAFASMTNVTAEVLRAISMRRIFMKNYTIVRNLITNPKTPLDVSLHLLPRLNAPDLLKLTANKNVPETLRSSAQKLHRKRKIGGPAH